MKFSLIVAIDLKRGIGKNGDLPWHVPEDLKYFKKITTAKNDLSEVENVVVMGRKTWESIPDKYRPLPDRYNIVLTRNSDYDLPEGVGLFNNFDDMLSTLKSDSRTKNARVFIIGGQQIFEKALMHPYCEKLYITHLDRSYDCDTYFPNFLDDFHEESHENFTSKDGLNGSFAIYVKNT